MPDTIEERLRRLRAQRSGQSIEERLAALRAQQQPPQEPEGAFSSFQTGVAGPLLRNVLNTAADIYNRPGETLERAGRAALEFASAFDPAGNAYQPTVASQEPRLQELRARAAAERPETLKLMELGMQQEEAKPKTRAGRIAGAVGRVAGEVAFPTAPESAVANIVTAPFAGAALKTVGRVAAPILSRIRGTISPKAAVEARQVIQEAVEASGGQATPTVQRAISQFEQVIDDIKAAKLSPKEKTKAFNDAVQRIGREASDIRPVSPQSRAGYPPLMEFPENPNAIQQAGILPGEGAAIARGASMRGPADIAPMEAGPPRLSAQMAPERFKVSAGEGYTETVGPRVGESAAMDIGPYGATRGAVPPADINAPFEPSWLRDPRQQPIFPQPPVEFTGVEPFAGDPLQAALFEGARGLPTPIMQRIKDEFLGTLGALKTLKSSFDISAPGRQGLLLLARPLQWRQSGKALGDMFRAFRTKDFKAINEAFARHPDAPIMREAGLELTGPGGLIKRGEEAYAKREGSWISQKVSNLPGVKQSDQMFTTMMDSQRVQRFLQYKKSIDKLGLDPREAMKGYKAAAQAVNIATGRGSLGQKIDKSFEALNYFLFSPRFVASRLNILNPVMYLRNAATPAGRAVLKGQMADLAQYAGTAAATLALFKAAGADVTLNPESPDFGKIRFGQYRYDIGAGLSQVMRLYYRVGEDLMRAGRGEKPQPGKTAIDIGETFLSYKLSPPAAAFRNFINQRTPDKKPFTAGRTAADLAAPMQWADFVDSYIQEGLGGAVKTLPGAVGIGVQNYEPKPTKRKRGRQ